MDMMKKNVITDSLIELIIIGMQEGIIFEIQYRKEYDEIKLMVIKNED